MGDNKIESFIHPRNKGGEVKSNKSSLEVEVGKKGSHELGDKSHLESVMAEPKGADVEGHDGKMKWK